MSWVKVSSRRGVRPGDRVAIYWPAEALPSKEASELDWLPATVMEGLKVRVKGQTFDLPQKGFRIWRQDGEVTAAKKAAPKYTLKQIEAAIGPKIKEKYRLDGHLIVADVIAALKEVMPP